MRRRIGGFSAHGDESPTYRFNPTREFVLNGQSVPIGDRELTRRPAALLGFLSAFRIGIGEFNKRGTDKPDEMTFQLAPDGSSVHEGCGGKHGQSWHDVAMEIVLAVDKVADSVFPLDKHLIASRHTKDQNESFLAALSTEQRATAFIVDFEQVDRFYAAIKRVIKQFSFEQLEARMRRICRISSKNTKAPKD